MKHALSHTRQLSANLGRHQNSPNLFLRGAAAAAAAASFCAAVFFSRLALKQVKVTMIIAQNSNTNATYRHQIAELKYA